MPRTLFEIFRKKGLLAAKLPAYQPRKAQYFMAKTVLSCLEEQQHGLIEAGTGTGKSFGYALPAAYWAMKEDKKVIVSTNTITLQNQLLRNELPLVKDILGQIDADWGKQFRFELAKGRGNYICKRKLEQYVSESLRKETAHADLATRVQKELPAMKIGDREELRMPIPVDFFSEISGDADDCMGKDSPFHDSCFIQQARRKLQKAQLIVVNHALFFTDLVLRTQGASILPDYDCVILDEAHRIEDQVTKQFQYTVNIDMIFNLFARFTRGRTHWARSIDDPSLKSNMEALYTRFHERWIELIAPLGKNLASREHDQYPLRRPIVEHYPFEEIFKEATQLIEEKKQSIEFDQGENETTISLGKYIGHLQGMDMMLRHLLLRMNSAEWATWVERTPPKKEPIIKDDVYWAQCLTLHSAPIEVAETLREHLFSKKTAILTSATLTTKGDFSFVGQRLGIDQFTSYEAASPFNYEEQSLLIVPDKAPLPTARHFDAYVSEAMKEVLDHTGGRTFLLFTSYSQMNKVYEEIAPWLAKREMKGLLHRAGVSREQMLRDFREADNTVLFGCETFWEGVDIPGSDLICVVISKLPFPPPTDPITQARTERLESIGKNAFEEYILPFSILRLKQGVGRLIRDQRDRGVIVILDSRLHQKRYGKTILNSLPNSPLTRNTTEIPSALKKWRLL